MKNYDMLTIKNFRVEKLRTKRHGADEDGNYFGVLYEFVEGEEVNPEQDANF